MNVIKFWIIIFAFVSIQLAWNLRPFVGAKNLEFELFRKKEGNFYLAIFQSIGSIIAPGRVSSEKNETVNEPKVEEPKMDTISKVENDLNNE